MDILAGFKKTILFHFLLSLLCLWNVSVAQADVFQKTIAFEAETPGLKNMVSAHEDLPLVAIVRTVDQKDSVFLKNVETNQEVNLSQYVKGSVRGMAFGPKLMPSLSASGTKPTFFGSLTGYSIYLLVEDPTTRNQVIVFINLGENPQELNFIEPIKPYLLTSSALNFIAIFPRMDKIDELYALLTTANGQRAVRLDLSSLQLDEKGQVATSLTPNFISKDGANILDLALGGNDYISDYPFRIVAAVDGATNPTTFDQLYLLSPKGDVFTPITQSSYHHQNPSFSPTGDVLAYEVIDGDSVRLAAHFFPLVLDKNVSSECQEYFLTSKLTPLGTSRVMADPEIVFPVLDRTPDFNAEPMIVAYEEKSSCPETDLTQEKSVAVSGVAEKTLKLFRFTSPLGDLLSTSCSVSQDAISEDLASSLKGENLSCVRLFGEKSVFYGFNPGQVQEYAPLVVDVVLNDPSVGAVSAVDINGSGSLKNVPLQSCGIIQDECTAIKTTCPDGMIMDLKGQCVVPTTEDNTLPLEEKTSENLPAGEIAPDPLPEVENTVPTTDPVVPEAEVIPSDQFDNSSVICPDGQEANPLTGCTTTLPKTCAEGEVLDANGLCITAVKPTECPDGQFSDATGTCVPFPEKTSEDLPVVEEAPAEETPAEEVPAEEVPAEEVPAEEAPVVEEAPVAAEQPVETTCPDGYTMTVAGDCVAPEIEAQPDTGGELEVDPAPDTSCPDGQTRNAAGVCVAEQETPTACPDGQTLNAFGQCETIAATPEDEEETPQAPQTPAEPVAEDSEYDPVAEGVEPPLQQDEAVQTPQADEEEPQDPENNESDSGDVPVVQPANIDAQAVGENIEESQPDGAFALGGGNAFGCSLSTVAVADSLSLSPWTLTTLFLAFLILLRINSRETRVEKVRIHRKTDRKS